MLVDGKAIAQEVLETVATSVAAGSSVPKLAIVTCAPNFETGKYLELKKRRAKEVGINATVIELMEDCTTEECIKTLEVAVDQSDGVVVQLPLPDHIDTDQVLARIPASHDVDGIHYDGEYGALPPVVGAIAQIAQRHEVSLGGKQVVVIGAGRLVGTPALLWAHEQGATVTLLTKETDEGESTTALATADIIISGAGVPGLITKDKIKDGVVIFDAGTSEDGGTLVGDADPNVAEVASLLTPVPGGIGPVTIACLLHNLVSLRQKSQ